MKGTKMLKSSGSKGTGELTDAHAPAEPLLMYKAKEDKDQTEEVDVKDEDLKAPVGLLMKFLRALTDKDFQLAVKLCHMILIYEPDNPFASEFLPLIQKKLLEEQSNDEESDQDDNDTESGSDEDSSHSSSCSSSSASDDNDHDDFDDYYEKENHVNRHKPCPSAHIYL